MGNIFHAKIGIWQAETQSFDLIDQNRISKTGLVQVRKGQLSSAHFGDDVVVESVGKRSAVKFFDEIGGANLLKY